jgi:hypothetical protein
MAPYGPGTSAVLDTLLLLWMSCFAGTAWHEGDRSGCALAHAHRADKIKRRPSFTPVEGIRFNSWCTPKHPADAGPMAALSP